MSKVFESAIKTIIMERTEEVIKQHVNAHAEEEREFYDALNSELENLEEAVRELRNAKKTEHRMSLVQDIAGLAEEAIRFVDEIKRLEKERKRIAEVAAMLLGAEGSK